MSSTRQVYQKMSEGPYWSQDYQRWYYVQYGADGQPIYTWVDAAAPPQSNHPAPLNQRHDSPTGVYYEPPEHIQGTSGSYERLDPRYYVRSGPECHHFFKKGRVFSMLWSEAAGQTSQRMGTGEAYTQVRYGEHVYSGIRRFVVLSVPREKGFVYACPISTYSGRGTLKPGCDPEDHAAICFETDAPYILQEEFNRGMTNEAILVESAGIETSLDKFSRINFGKTVAIEKNVKVKDVGRVTTSHMSNLAAYWDAARDQGV